MGLSTERIVGQKKRSDRDFIVTKDALSGGKIVTIKSRLKFSQSVRSLVEVHQPCVLRESEIEFAHYQHLWVCKPNLLLRNL